MDPLYDDLRWDHDRPAVPRRRRPESHPGYYSDDEAIDQINDPLISRARAPPPPDFRPEFRRGSSLRERPRDRTPPPLLDPRASRDYLSPPNTLRSRSVSVNREPRIRFRRNDRSPSPGVLPPSYVGVSAPRAHLPEIGRSRASQARMDRRAWTNKPTAYSDSLDQPPRRPASPDSSGLRGDKAYRYKRLEWMEFRLVRILPARMSTIKCEIIHASLKYPPSYVAISYAWGDVGDKKRIQLDGYTISITSSLHGALEAVREKSEPLFIWADALCIDQQNGNERTEQVQLMTRIYAKAESVAIWLGPEADDSTLAIDLLKTVADQADSSERISRLISTSVGRRDFAAAVSLFERDYWRRLWVVQEVLNAKAILVYCGRAKLPWSVFARSSDTFRRHRIDLDHHFPGGLTDGKSHIISQSQLAYSQVLSSQGPGSFNDLESLVGHGEGSLLDVLRACRRKLASEPRDKVFGILGILAQQDRIEFPPDYNLSVKDVYTNVVDYLLATTESLDVICEAIYFPLHTSSTNLPTWVPDWSHIPQTAALSLSHDFSASRNTKADFQLLGDRRNKLEISAIHLDTIKNHGVAVGTLCVTGDYCMAFLHWRALLLGHWDLSDEKENISVQADLCKTLCLGQVPPKWDSPSKWLTVVYHVFATLIRNRLPDLPLDAELEYYANLDVDISPDGRRRLIYEHCGGRMMGRTFCLTAGGRMGMGTGFMAPGDIIVVPLGCSTPVILRAEGGRGEYRFVGDVYVSGYMYGRAVDQWKDGSRKLQKFVLH